MEELIRADREDEAKENNKGVHILHKRLVV